MSSNIDYLLELIAKDTHRSVEVVRKDMETQIRQAYQDPIQKKKMIELFGNEIPSLETFLEKTTLKRYIKK